MFELIKIGVDWVKYINYQVGEFTHLIVDYVTGFVFHGSGQSRTAVGIALAILIVVLVNLLQSRVAAVWKALQTFFKPIPVKPTFEHGFVESASMPFGRLVGAFVTCLLTWWWGVHLILDLFAQIGQFFGL